MEPPRRESNASPTEAGFASEASIGDPAIAGEARPGRSRLVVFSTGDPRVAELTASLQTVEGVDVRAIATLAQLPAAFDAHDNACLFLEHFPPERDALQWLDDAERLLARPLAAVFWTEEDFDAWLASDRGVVWPFPAAPNEDALEALMQAAEFVRELRTRRDEVLESLEDAEARFYHLVKNSADALLVVDRRGVVRYGNPTAEQFFNEPASAMIGEPLGLPIQIGHSGEFTLHTPPNAPRLVQAQTIEISWGEEPALLASFRDVSDRQRLKKLRRELADVLADGMRPTLESLDATLKRLSSDESLNDDADERESLLADARRRVERLGEVVEDLGEFSGLESGTLDLKFRESPIIPVLENVVARFTSRAVKRGIALTVEAPSSLPTVLAAPERIEAMLANLLRNALRFTPSGGAVSIRARAAGDALELTVSDNGVGMSPAVKQQVLEPFVCTSGRTSDPSAAGAGLGLTIVRQLVEAHGGSIAIESEPEEGTQVTIRIPVFTERLAERAALEQALHGAAASQYALIAVLLSERAKLEGTRALPQIQQALRGLLRARSDHVIPLPATEQLVILLDDTPAIGARRVHEKLSSALRDTSQELGAVSHLVAHFTAPVCYPDDGDNPRELLEALEERVQEATLRRG